MPSKKNKPSKTDTYKRFTIDLPSKLHRKIKMKAIKTEKTMKQIVCECLDKHIRGVE